MPTILVIDDNPSVATALDVLFSLHDLRTLRAESPRAGLERAALDAIVALAPATLAYVSCDPSTLARDVKRLIAAGYELNEVKPFDLFPQTFHVETIVLMSRIKD